MPKILHCADLHLDSPFRGAGAERSQARRKELRNTFLSLIEYVKSNKTDIVLMAGDLFDSELVTWETAELVTKALASVPGTKFVISPGNHDPYTDTSIYSKCAFSENVFIFKKPEISVFRFPELNTDVYGYAFTSPSVTVNPAAGFLPDNFGRVNLLCAHGDVGVPLSSYCPISVDDIAGSGFDYCAFGHVHGTLGIQNAGNTAYAYSGCLEGRDFGETGYKGAIELEIEKTGDKLYFDSRFIRFSRRRYEIAEVDVTGASDMTEIAAKVLSAVTSLGYGEDTLLRTVIKGNISPSLKCDTAAMEKILCEKLYYVEVEDSTSPILNAEALMADHTVRGAFFRELLPKIESGTSEEREAAVRALRVGLAALSGEDFISVK